MKDYIVIKNKETGKLIIITQKGAIDEKRKSVVLPSSSDLEDNYIQLPDKESEIVFQRSAASSAV